MAIYHMHQGVVSRSAGRSAVAAYSYITATKNVDERIQTLYNYSNKKNVEATGFLSIEGAPQWAQCPETFWQQAELFEDRLADKRFRGHSDPEKNARSLETKEKFINSAQTAYTVEASLPIELNFEQCESLVKRFVEKEFQSRGHPASWAIHWETGNPHFHVMTSTRQVSTEGFSERKNRDLVSKAGLMARRESWAIEANHALELAGFKTRIDHRSYKDQGLSIQPTVHEGYQARALLARNELSRIGSENDQIVTDNKTIIQANPHDILRKLANENVIFTELDVKREVMRFMMDDHQGFLSVFNYLLDHRLPIELNGFTDAKVYEGRWSTETRADFERAIESASVSLIPSLLGNSNIMSLGETVKGERVYSTIEMVEREAKILTTAQSIAHTTVDRLKEADILTKLEQNYPHILANEQQKQAALSLCDNKQMAHLIGRAGSGKTTLLQPIAQVYEEAGYRVLGMAFQGATAEIMEQKIKCSAHTIHKYIDAWKRIEDYESRLAGLEGRAFNKARKALRTLEPFRITKNDVIIIDEANMVGMDLWEKILEKASLAGAKIITAGDDAQAKSHAGSDIYRELLNLASSSEISQVYRQKQEWQKEASLKINQHKMADGLQAYMDRGFIHWSEDKNTAVNDLAKAYVESFKESPNSSRIALSYTNKDVQALNQAIRHAYQDLGKLGESLIIEGREFSVGDRIVFLQNDNSGSKVKTIPQESLLERMTPSFTGLLGLASPRSAAGANVGTGIKNGNLGTLLGFNAKTQELEVKLDSGRTVRLNPKDYAHFTHGYAITINKSEGGDWDQVFKLESGMETANIATVVWTRHRENVWSFVDGSRIKDFKELSMRSERADRRYTTQDFILTEKEQVYFNRVASLVECTQNQTTILNAITEAKGHSKQTLWTSYGELNHLKQSLAREIVHEWGKHRRFVEQTHFTQRSLEEMGGVRQKLLSEQEQKLSVYVDHYRDIASEVRSLGAEMRESHPGSLNRHHSKYTQYEALKAERDSIASVLVENLVESRQFFKSVEVIGEDRSNAPITHPSILNSNASLSPSISSIAVIEHGHQHFVREQEKFFYQRLNTSQQKCYKLLQSYVNTQKDCGSWWQQIKQSTLPDSGLTLQSHENFSKYQDASALRNSLALDIIDKLDDSMAGLLSHFSIKETQLLDQAYTHQQTALTKSYLEAISLETQRPLAAQLQAGLKYDKLKGQSITYHCLNNAGANLKQLNYVAWLNKNYAPSQTEQWYPELGEKLTNYSTLTREIGQLWGAAQDKGEDVSSTHNTQLRFQELLASNPDLISKRNQLAFEIHRDLSTYENSARNTLYETLKINPHVLETSARAYVRSQGKEVDLPSPSKENSIHRDGFSPTSASGQEKLQEKPKFINREVNLPLNELQQRLNDKIEILAYDLLPRMSDKKITQRHSTLTCGSINVELQGDKKGSWTRFSTGEGGGPLQLIEATLGFDKKRAIDYARSWLGNPKTIEMIEIKVKEKTQTIPKVSEWTPILPVPENAPPFASLREFAFKHKDHHLESLHPYYNKDSKLIGFIGRYVHRDSHQKETLPITYCVNSKGEQAWRMKGFGEDKPLYNLPKLLEDSSRLVLIVEGEKTAAAAQELFPNIAVVSWSGGAQGYSKSDWTVLKDREVVIWPDNDKAGHEAAEGITNLLEEVGAQSIKTVGIPQKFPVKWDLADQLPAEITLNDIEKMIGFEPTPTKAQDIPETLAKKPPSPEELLKAYIEIDTERSKLPPIYRDLSKEQIQAHNLLRDQAAEIGYQIAQNKDFLEQILDEKLKRKVMVSFKLHESSLSKSLDKDKSFGWEL